MQPLATGGMYLGGSNEIAERYESDRESSVRLDRAQGPESGMGSHLKERRYREGDRRTGPSRRTNGRTLHLGRHEKSLGPNGVQHR